VPIPLLVLPAAVVERIEAGVQSAGPEVKDALIADAVKEADGLLREVAKMARKHARRAQPGSNRSPVGDTASK
jgi:hypothetical protein